MLFRLVYRVTARPVGVHDEGFLLKGSASGKHTLDGAQASSNGINQFICQPPAVSLCELPMKYFFALSVALVLNLDCRSAKATPQNCAKDLTGQLNRVMTSLTGRVDEARAALDAATAAQDFLSKQRAILRALHNQNAWSGFTIPVLMDSDSKALGKARIRAAVDKFLGTNTVAMKFEYLEPGGWTVTIYQIRPSAAYSVSEVTLDLDLPALEIPTCNYWSSGAPAKELTRDQFLEAFRISDEDP